MTLRDAARQSPILTAGALFAGIWILLSTLRAYNAITWGEAGFVGANVVGGVVGVGVMIAVLGLLTVLFSEIGESDPSPDTFPPER